MAFKHFQLEELLITIYKRRASRSMRLSVKADGSVRVSIPTWVPYKSGLGFAQSRLEWIRSQRQQQPAGILVHGQAIGKAHRLLLVPDITASRLITRVKQTEITVRYPASMNADSGTVQQAAAKASIRALRAQAERLLPIRLSEVAAKHDYSYGTVTIKALKSRWGSCDHQANITLNLFLMQLPWEYIDYVLLHELAHTRVMQHGPPFWAEMSRHLSNAKQVRAQMRAYQPILHTGLPLAVA